MPEPPAILVGTAGWTIPRRHAGAFPASGSHLARYAARLPAVEINSSFYRPHRPATYARWAATVPPGFRFAVKLPREISHRRRLVDAEAPLDRFLDETAALGVKRGPLLLQLPPSLRWDAARAGTFLALLRARHAGPVACEPRHPSWFGAAADRMLAGFHIARVAADPAVVPAAAVPGGWPGLVYWRLHGSPRMYYSRYDPATLAAIAAALHAARHERWCILDNTALGEATSDALALLAMP